MAAPSFSAARHAGRMLHQRAGDLPRPQAAQDQRLEAQAQRAAAAPQAAGPVSARHGAATQRAVPGLGRPLPAGLLAGLPRVGIDLHTLRIHDDEAAAQAADEAGARAYTQGRDIVFGRGQWQPQQPAGQALLAHEVTHAAQQARPGAAAGVQRDPVPGTGPGRNPPSERFTTMPEGETGVEDGHVLFARDEAVLDASDRDTLDALVAGAAPGAAVHVHGYASAEGDADYNRNLSAHRAVAVKQYLEGILPPETRIVAYAYGETTAFGGRPQNRRVGVDLIEAGGLFNPDAGDRFRLHLLPPDALRLRVPSLPGGPGTPGTPQLLDELRDAVPLPRVSPDAPAPSLLLPPDLMRPPEFDYSGTAGSFAERGLPYGAAEARSAHDLYLQVYGNYLNLGLGRDLAASAAQLTVDSAVSSNLSVQFPNRQEQLDRQMQTEPTIVPIFNEAILRWLLDRR